MSKLFKVSAICLITLSLSGCIGDLQSALCVLMGDDADHCFQGAAIQDADPTGCDKIKGEGFEDAGSNPPKDKCYLLIAENTGDFEVCKNIKGGLMSYTQEECFLSTAVKNEDPSGCKYLSGGQKSECLSQTRKFATPDKVLEIDDQIKILEDELKNGSDSAMEQQLKGLKDKRNDLLGVMPPEVKKEYERQSDPTNKMIIGDFAVGELDSATKEKLINLNERLKGNGYTMSDEQYEAIKDYYKFVSDPANDIEKMNDEELLKDRWNEKLGNVVDKIKIWKSNPTAEEAALDQQLRFYERMLERQAAINQGLSEYEQDMDRNIGILAGAGGDIAKDKIGDWVLESLLGKAASTATSVTTKVVDEALSTVKAEAQSMEFRGLVKAYDDGMAEEIGRFGGNVEKAHAAVIQKLQQDPYTYASGDSFAKYGNLLENKDCDGSNPHCINREVFWKAMKKSYQYQHK